MSKVDALRAMREARYARQSAARPAAAAPVRPDVPAPRRPAKAEVPAEAPAADELCGHRNTGGRTCTREQGHTAKSHRYS